MKEMICIVCPAGCKLEIDKNLAVSGNGCKKGAEFAVAEMTNPMRTLCSTARTAFDDVPVLPVRLSGEIPKGRIFDVMKEINKVTVRERIGLGAVIIADVLGLGVDVIVTSGVLLSSKK